MTSGDLPEAGTLVSSDFLSHILSTFKFRLGLLISRTTFKSRDDNNSNDISDKPPSCRSSVVPRTTSSSFCVFVSFPRSDWCSSRCLWSRSQLSPSLPSSPPPPPPTTDLQRHLGCMLTPKNSKYQRRGETKGHVRLDKNQGCRSSLLQLGLQEGRYRSQQAVGNTWKDVMEWTSSDDSAVPENLPLKNSSALSQSSRTPVNSKYNSVSFL